MSRLGLTLITGPANAGKLRRLLDAYLEALPLEPVLIVPNRSDVELVERELVARCGALLGGSIGTFDDLFRRIAAVAANARSRHRRAGGARARARGRVDLAERPLRLGALARVRSTRSARRSGSSSPGCSSRRARRRPRAALRGLPGGARPARPRRPRARTRARPRIAWPATSTPGTASRCSPTASRT